MEDIKKVYKEIKKGEDLGEDGFKRIMAIPFKDRLKLIREMILDGPETDFDFYKIEALAKYSASDDYFQTLAIIRYTIKNLYTSKNEGCKALIQKLQDYQEELVNDLKGKNLDYTPYLVKMANNYNAVMQDMIRLRNTRGMMASLHLYNQAMEIFLEAKDTGYAVEIAKKLSTLSFVNVESERLIIVTIKEFLMGQKFDNPVIPSSR